MHIASLSVAFKKGTTRRTLVLGPFAFKFARGKTGRRCNLYEAECYKTESPANRAILCPVVACSRRGLLLIQRAAKPLSQEDQHHLLKTDGFPEWEYTPNTEGSPFEYKASDWGWFNGKLVAVDYSAPAILDPDEKRRLMDQNLRHLFQADPAD